MKGKTSAAVPVMRTERPAYLETPRNRKERRLTKKTKKKLVRDGCREE